MRIRLIKLRLLNFKGIREFVLDAQGKDVRVYGDNGTGKTTLSDAWHWLLFGKDSKDQANFEIKTLDQNNEPIHNLEHEVEGVLEIDGKKLKLRRVFREVWTKKKGSAKETFSGHTTDYFINDVPVKAGEYNDRIAEIVDEKVFKMLTNPAFFNEVLHWEERRNILLEVAGDITDEEVISSDKRLERLAEVLTDRTIKEHRKMIRAQQKQINEELEKIPVRIDEVYKSLPAIDIDQAAVEKNLSELRKQKQEKEKELLRVESGGEVADKEKRLAELETELLKVRNQLSSQNEERVQELLSEINGLRNKISETDSKIQGSENFIKTNNSMLETLEKRRQELRTKWFEVNEQQTDVKDTCPTCGQCLPPEQVEETVKKANLEKAKKLEDITREGKAVAGEIEGLKQKNAEMEQAIEKLKAEREVLQKEHQKLDAELTALNQANEAYKEDKQYKSILAEIDALKTEIQQIKANKIDSIEAVKKEIRDLENKILIEEQRLAMFSRLEEGQKRIAELEEREKELAKVYENLEEELYLCDEFERIQAEMLESRINSKFKVVNFKLFRELVNGGLEPCCETLVLGVPYTTNLNTGARINAGIDIINTLSKHYNFEAPMFVDNAESITQLLPTDSQVISLIVSEQDKALRVEIDDKKTAKEAV